MVKIEKQEIKIIDNIDLHHVSINKMGTAIGYRVRKFRIQSWHTVKLFGLFEFKTRKIIKDGNY